MGDEEGSAVKNGDGEVVVVGVGVSDADIETIRHSNDARGTKRASCQTSWFLDLGAGVTPVTVVY